MKLIDGKVFADEILGRIFERGQASSIWKEQLEIGAITYRDIEFADGYDNALEDIYRRINNAPTVEAIPVEYIEKFKKEFRAVASVKWVIDWLLEKWERENANNN